MCLMAVRMKAELPRCPPWGNNPWYDVYVGLVGLRRILCPQCETISFLLGTWSPWNIFKIFQIFFNFLQRKGKKKKYKKNIHRFPSLTRNFENCRNLNFSRIPSNKCTLEDRRFSFIWKFYPSSLLIKKNNHFPPILAFPSFWVRNEYF